MWLNYEYLNLFTRQCHEEETKKMTIWCYYQMDVTKWFKAQCGNRNIAKKYIKIMKNNVNTDNCKCEKSQLTFHNWVLIK